MTDSRHIKQYSSLNEIRDQLLYEFTCALDDLLTDPHFRPDADGSTSITIELSPHLVEQARSRRTSVRTALIAQLRQEAENQISSPKPS